MEYIYVSTEVFFYGTPKYAFDFFLNTELLEARPPKLRTQQTPITRKKGGWVNEIMIIHHNPKCNIGLVSSQTILGLTNSLKEKKYQHIQLRNKCIMKT